MPDFEYTARNMTGQLVTGTMAAATERDVLSQLTSQSLFPVKVEAGKKQGASVFRSKRVSGQVLATLYGQLSSLLRSGVPLLRSLNLLRDQSSHAGLKEILEDVHAKVEDGSTLAEAMERHERTFRPMTVSMVRAGSEGGFLEDALDRVSTFTEEQEDLKARTLGALAYPIFLSVFGTLVVTALIVFFVPSFAEMFERLREKGELPVATEVLLKISDTVNAYGFIILGVLIGIGVLLRRQLLTDRGQRFADKIKLRIPILGTIFRNLSIARICRVLGTLLKNGVPILRSLEISQQAAGNHSLSDVLVSAAENVSSGDPLAKPLARSEHFPPEIVEMISVAEESNTMDTVLVDIADRLETRTSRRLDLFVRLLEPILLLILATIVMMVVIALLLPIMKMSSTL
ncbi:MAG: type II secretion system F family protein [Planctomycetota bacterium]